MTFTQALNQMCDGKRVTRTEWDNKEEYGLIQNDTLRIHINGKFCDWIVTMGDILPEDWEVL